MANPTQIQLRRDTAANWALANTVMALGEPGYDTTNKIFKIGDGVTAWGALQVASGALSRTTAQFSTTPSAGDVAAAAASPGLTFVDSVTRQLSVVSADGLHYLPQAYAAGGMSYPNAQKLRRVMLAAKASNPIDNAVPSFVPTVTTAFDGTLATFTTCDPTSAATVASMNLLGGNWTKDAGNPRWLPVADAVDASRYATAIIEFTTDAPKVQIRTAAGTLFITVDGYPINKSGNANAGSGGENQVVIDFTSDPAGARRARTFTVTCGGAVWFYRVGVDNQSKMWAPLKDDALRCYLEGDSYIAGTMGNPGTLLAPQALAHYACLKAGIRDIWNGGVGGTGYLVTGAYTTLRQRIAAPIASKPNLVIVGAGTNDVSLVSGVQAEAALYFAALRAGLPGVPIIVFGPWSKNTGPSAAMVQVEQAVVAALTALSDPLIAFVPFANAAQGAIISGTGYDNNGTPTGSTTGNAILYIGADQAHPNLVGQTYHGRYIYDGISAALTQFIGLSA